ncbi:hypothetical protein O181_028066 [Austropuccinia psidii MF-1]|uniref:Tet-like 2OG-Fe(II) oxygenase domain-containing protein n=1 Tax=Austropuccinia psidii MF-1 TaxID=1389203 RepID=A0A9Q3H214_9BASI|nr:hypothetical protein [Austropuccinia psidii MF-1]
MYAIGWRPPQLGYFTIGCYINSTSISHNLELYNSLSLQLSKLQNIIQNIFEKLSSAVFEINLNQMKQFNIPGFEILDFTDFYSSSFANQIKFTLNKFSNFPHINQTDSSEFAYFLFISISTSDGTLIFDNFDLFNEFFVFPDHSINIDLTGKEPGIVQMVWKGKGTRNFTLYPDGGDSSFSTRLSMSLQISKKVYSLFKNLHNGKVDNFTVDDHNSIINRLASTSK